MKKILLLLPLILIFAFLYSTDINTVTYTSNTQWRLSGSPYNVLGDVTVARGVTLTIDPGVVVNFSRDKKFIINGTLCANGTAISKIIMSSSGTNYWKGINLSNSSGSSLTYCKISNTCNMGAINAVNGSNITISNCEIFGNQLIYSNNDDLIATAVFLKDIPAITLTYNKIYSNNSLYNSVYRSSTVKIIKTPSIASGSSNISYNTIYDNFTQNGGGLFCRNEAYANPNPVNITYNNIYKNNASASGGGIFAEGRNIHINNNVINENQSYYGGAIAVTSYTINADNIIKNQINNNTLSFNHSTNNGGGIYLSVDNGSSIADLNENVVHHNDSGNNGGGIYLLSYRDESYSNSIFCNNQIFLNSAVNGGGLYAEYCDMDLNHNTITENACTTNGAGIYASNPSSGDINIKNSILWNNKTNGVSGCQIYTSGAYQSTTSYSCIQNGTAGVVNTTYPASDFSTNPMFIDRYSYNFGLESSSSCINSGEAGTYVGAKAFDIANNTSFQSYSLHTSWNWIAFPKLDRDADTDNGVAINSVLEGVGDNGNTLQNDLLNNSYYDNDNFVWPISPISQIYTSEGYKINMTNLCTFTVPGKTINPLTPITLATNHENWVGYFLPESLTPEEALGEAMNSLTSIKTETWAMSRPNINSIWITGSTVNHFNYGDMVALTIPSGVPALSYIWRSDSAKKALNPPKYTSSFEYLLQADYTPVYVTYVSDNPPSEIAVYANGVCKGASEYEGEVTQINAYLTPGDLDAELTFTFAYDSKDKMEKNVHYVVINPENQTESNRPILYQKGDEFYQVKISKSAGNTDVPVVSYVKNYPNPFNPETTIFFNTSSEGQVNVSVYNVKGQKICDLANSVMSSGNHRLTWSGKDSKGKQVGSGIYLYKVSAGKNTIIRKMTLIK